MNFHFPYCSIKSFTPEENRIRTIDYRYKDVSINLMQNHYIFTAFLYHEFSFYHTYCPNFYTSNVPVNVINHAQQLNVL